ncbi:MAG: hypothetical protein QM217_02970 [Bacillota bacterium]|jgi:DNA-binding MarR family transcriptional regulator|nr:hypothetical protein [Bacillota bacterium]
MLKYVFSQEQMECLNHIIGEKNDISLLNNFATKELSDTDKEFFVEKGIINSDGMIQDDIKESVEILSKPASLVKLMFTGGINKYEHTICYDKSLKKKISFTSGMDYFTLDNGTNDTDVLALFEDFVGKSSMKSVSFYQKLSSQEALVTAALLDMERRTILRAFVDELPYTNNRYSFNMIWRMVHSSNASIQWFVYCIGEVLGEHLTLKQDHLKKVLEQLVEIGLISEHDGQYQLSDSLSQLSNRMIVIDNVLSVETIGTDKEDKQVSSGFTCLQSGIHDLLRIDYDGTDVVFETISSALLLENIERFMKMEAFTN